MQPTGKKKGTEVSYLHEDFTINSLKHLVARALLLLFERWPARLALSENCIVSDRIRFFFCAVFCCIITYRFILIEQFHRNMLLVSSFLSFRFLAWWVICSVSLCFYFIGYHPGSLISTYITIRFFFLSTFLLYRSTRSFVAWSRTEDWRGFTA